MFRIRQVTVLDSPRGLADILEVKRLLRERLPGISEEDVESLPKKLVDPLSARFRGLLFLAEEPVRGQRRGFALMTHASDEGIAFLDYLVTRGRETGGVGAALYERVREEAKALKAEGLFFECLPDDPAALSDPSLAPVNAARLRFYARFGARPIIGTGYETPLSEGDLDLPHLIYDDLDSGVGLSNKKAKTIVRTILERKYPVLCPAAYVEAVVESIVDDPIRVRPARSRPAVRPVRPVDQRIEDLVLVCVNDRHDIHHVKERGYVEAPVRINAILAGLEATGRIRQIPPKHHSGILERIHDRQLIDFLTKACEKIGPGESIYPYVFPVRNPDRPPRDLTYAAGYYCIDTFTPINRNSFLAARRAVDCALTAARAVREGQRFAYALVRPPGHHAERRVFGGFCYFNNGAAAAEFLSDDGKVAILDLDYHHGNGQQDIFWERSDVLTVSIHGHPSIAYPFFTGFEEEVGGGPGTGFNLNLPLPQRIEWPRYEATLKLALKRIREFDPIHLVVSLGFDTGKADPTGSWPLVGADFLSMGRLVASLGLPTVIVQEGGYRTASLAKNAGQFFTGLQQKTPS